MGPPISRGDDAVLRTRFPAVETGGRNAAELEPNPMHCPCLTVTTALALAAISIPVAYGQATASAAPKDEAVQLSVFEVTTSRDIGYQSTNAAEVTRMNTPIENIPMNVSIYNQQFIEDLLATDTSQLLAYEAAAVKTNENDNFLLRGFSNPGSNFLNGFAQTAGFGSQPLANIERVEVIRGPAAILYGAGGYGGTINRITKQPQARTFANGRVIASDYQSFRTEVDANLPLAALGNKVMVRLNGIYDRGYNWFHTKIEEDGIAPSIRWDPTERTKVIAEYFYSFNNRPGGWATPVHNGDPKGIVTGDGVYRLIPRKTQWNSPEDYRQVWRRVGSLDVRHAFTAQLQFRAQFQFETKNQQFLETFASPESLTILRDTALTSRSWRYLPRDVENYRSRAELVWNVATGPLNHRLLFGYGWIQQYDLNQQWLSSRNYGGLTGAALTGPGRLSDAQAGRRFNEFPNLTYVQFLANPNLAGYNTNLLLPINLLNRGVEPALPPPANRPPLYFNTDTKTFLANQDYYLNDVFSFAHDRVYVMAGLRHTEFQRKTIAWQSGAFPNRVRLATAPTAYSLTDGNTESGGAVWHLNAEKTLSLYGNLNRSFNPEFRTQPDGSPLDPEEGRQKEIGLRFALVQGRVGGLVSFYDLLQNNVTEADPLNPGYFVQRSGQRSTGVEFSLNGRVNDNWLVLASYANTRARDDRTGVASELVPHHRFTAVNRFTVNRGVWRGVGFTLGAIYTGERPLTPTSARSEPNWGPLPAVWRIDTAVSYRFRPAGSRFAYDFAFNVTNVLDRTDLYYLAAWDRATIDPGRVWRFAVGVKF
jgi:iron complex outermembrane recepter protein